MRINRCIKYFLILTMATGVMMTGCSNNNTTTSVKIGNFLLEAETDFIFAIVGEELGFVGCCVVVFLLLLIIISLCLYWCGIVCRLNDISLVSSYLCGDCSRMIWFIFEMFSWNSVNVFLLSEDVMFDIGLLVLVLVVVLVSFMFLRLMLIGRLNKE